MNRERDLHEMVNSLTYKWVTIKSKKFITSFVTSDGHFEFNRMPFGLVNVLPIFNSRMNRLIEFM